MQAVPSCTHCQQPAVCLQVGEEELAALFGSVGRVEEVQLFKAFPRCRLSKVGVGLSSSACLRANSPPPPLHHTPAALLAAAHAVTPHNAPP